MLVQSHPNVGPHQRRNLNPVEHLRGRYFVKTVNGFYIQSGSKYASANCEHLLKIFVTDPQSKLL